MPPKLTSPQTIIYNSEDVNRKIIISSANMATLYGEPWYFLHRVDLHNELKDMVINKGAANGNVAKLHLSTSVSNVEKDGTIEFADGNKTKRDVVVVADGIRVSF
jgi:salicylate hydroxylase